MSIHEHRCCYQDNLWGPSLPATDGYGGQDIRQVWFAGVHSDIGGSYSETTAGLSKITFEWLLMEAVKHGLIVDSNRVEILLGQQPPPEFLPHYVPPDPHGILHPSLKGFWWLLEYFPRRRNGHWDVPRGKWVRKIPENSVIHETVRLSGQPVTLPQAYNEEKWVRFSAATAEAAPVRLMATAEHPKHLVRSLARR